MKFFTRFGGVETNVPWNHPTSEQCRRWRDSLSFDLTDWYICGNFIEQYSPTWDIDILLIQNPLKIDLNDLSNMFTEMIDKGFKNELLIDPAWMDKFYQDEWEPVTKIRPDDRFYKEMRGAVYNPIYQADEKKQIHKQLWEFKYLTPHDNWWKGKNRNYNFTGVELQKF